MTADIDSSFYDIDNDTVYFTRAEYLYSFTNTGLERIVKRLYGYHVSDVFPGVAPDINAAFYYRPNSTVYFFRQYHYWAYDMGHRHRTGSLQAQPLKGYPRLITDFEGMPANIDAIYSDNSGTYHIFYGVFFATFTDDQFKIGMKLEFKLSSVDFFGCNPYIYGDYKQYKNNNGNRIWSDLCQQITRTNRL